MNEDVKLYEDIAYMKGQMQLLIANVNEMRNDLNNKYVPRTEFQQKVDEIKSWVKGFAWMVGIFLVLIQVVFMWYGINHK